MNTRTAVASFIGVALLTPLALLARQNILKNGSMEYGEGPSALDPQVAADWTEFGINVERSPTVNLVPPGAGHALKAFGDATSNAAGATQEIRDITPGMSVTASVQLYTPNFDKLRGSGQAGLLFAFLNQFGGTIQPTYEVYPLDASSPADTWIPAVIGPLTAPPGTAKVRITCRLRWNVGDIGGAAYWDDAQVLVNSDPNNRVSNGDFETMGHSEGQSPVGIDDWVGFNDQEKSNDVAKDGLASLKVGTREAYSGLWQNMKALQAGDHLYLKGFVWNPASDPLTGSAAAGLKLEFAPNAQVPPPVETLSFDANSPANTWTLVELSNVVVPAGVTTARVVCILAADAQTTGTVYFDAAYAEHSDAPGVNQLLNWSFEDGPGGANGIDYWTEFGSDVSTTRLSCFAVPPLHGDCTARSGGTAVTGIYQEFPVVENQTVTFRAYLYTPSSDRLGGTGKAGVKIEWRFGNVPPWVDIGGPNNTIFAGAPTNQWLPLYIDYTMPPGSSAMTRFVCIVAKGTALTGKVYFDACEAVVLNRFDGSDYDGDDDEDLHDAAQFQLRYTGSGGPLPWNGMVFDSDDDGDIDLGDFTFFAPRMTGVQ